ncbi:MAG: NUDIX hydrolase [Demequina sp.]|uniref:NUDIX hydrolase n=1 Tax=Demequina sp. TaxID=2050685 RepID=UPI003A8AC410
MATPEFILSLRERVGHAPLWLSGVTAVVVRESAADARGREILLVRRADTGAWTPVTGIIDPGEHPAVAGARETLEETGVIAAPQALVRVGVTPVVTYANGDVTQYLDLVFRFRYVSGDPHPADGENSEVSWFPVDAMPPMSEDMQARVAAGLSGSDVAEFTAP